MARQKGTTQKAKETQKWQKADMEQNEGTAIEKVKKSWVRNKQENFGQENVEPGDNSRFLRHALASWDLPVIDISDPKQVEDRIKLYFTNCLENDMKPNMVGMANWLGVSRDTLNSWKRGEYRSGTHSDLIIKSLGMLEELWVDYMQNGKINPASGIFLAKNMFGYRDVIDIAPTQAPPLGDQLTPEAIAAKYEELPED